MLSLISCRSGIFRRRELRSINKPNYASNIWMKNWTTKREIPGGWELKTPAFLALFECNCKWIRWRGALLAKEPLPHSGAQSASRWIPWISTFFWVMHLDLDLDMEYGSDYLARGIFYSDLTLTRPAISRGKNNQNYWISKMPTKIYESDCYFSSRPTSILIGSC